MSGGVSERVGLPSIYVTSLGDLQGTTSQAQLCSAIPLVGPVALSHAHGGMAVSC